MHLSNQSLLVIILVGIIAGWLAGRVMEGGDWTLFSPSTCPDLHDKFGKDFESGLANLKAVTENQPH